MQISFTIEQFYDAFQRDEKAVVFKSVSPIAHRIANAE